MRKFQSARMSLVGFLLAFAAGLASFPTLVGFMKPERCGIAVPSDGNAISSDGLRWAVVSRDSKIAYWPALRAPPAGGEHDGASKAR
jgi:hypothetical protein